MSKIDELGGRAAAHLKTAVTDHLEDHPTRAPRSPSIPRPAVALALVLVVALVGALSGPGSMVGDTRVRIGDRPEQSEKNVDLQTDDSGPTAGDSVADPEQPGAPSRGGSGQTEGSATGQSPQESPLPQEAPPRDPGNEPGSSESLLSMCPTTINAPGSVQTPEWCMLATAEPPNEKDPKQRHVLSVDLGRHPQAGDAVLHFDLRQEADFMITDRDGREIWRWSRTRAVTPHAHERPVRAGTAIRWAVLWNERDQSGAKVPDGSYRLLVTVQAREMNGAWARADQELVVGEQ